MKSVTAEQVAGPRNPGKVASVRGRQNNKSFPVADRPRQEQHKLQEMPFSLPPLPLHPEFQDLVFQV